MTDRAETAARLAAAAVLGLRPTGHPLARRLHARRPDEGGRRAGRTTASRSCASGRASPPERMLELAEAFDRTHPEITVVLAADLDAPDWIRAMRAGVRDIVSPAAIDEQLPAADAPGTRAPQSSGGPTCSATRPASTSRVITVLSPKGGAGKTTVATNLAVALAERRTGSTALVDLDLQFGDVSAALQLEPEHTLADVGRCGHRRSTRRCSRSSSARHRSGLYVLCAPDVAGRRRRHRRSRRATEAVRRARRGHAATSWSTPPPASTRPPSGPSSSRPTSCSCAPSTSSACAACARSSTRSTRSA